MRKKMILRVRMIWKVARVVPKQKKIKQRKML